MPKDFSLRIQIFQIPNGVDCIIHEGGRGLLQIRRVFFYMFGYPNTLVIDNGPPFQGQLFKEYCMRRGIQLIHAPPYHPPSNGPSRKSSSIY